MMEIQVKTKITYLDFLKDSLSVRRYKAFLSKRDIFLYQDLSRFHFHKEIGSYV